LLPIVGDLIPPPINLYTQWGWHISELYIHIKYQYLWYIDIYRIEIVKVVKD